MEATYTNSGITLIQSDSNVAHGVNVYTADTKEDIKKLPLNCKPGSQALCIEDGEVYILTTKREWKPIG